MAYQIEIPEELADRVRSAAEAKGMSPATFVAQTLEARLEQQAALPADDSTEEANRPWMRYFGISSDLAEEIERIQVLIDETFEVIDEEDPL